MTFRQELWPRDSQPQEVVAPALWLPAGSVIYTPPTGIVGSDGIALLGTPVSIDDQAFVGGRGIVGSASTSRLPIGNLAMADATFGITIVAQFVSATTSQRYLAATVSTGTSYIEDIGVNQDQLGVSAGKVVLQFRSTSGNISIAGSTNAVLTQGKLHTIAWQWFGGGNFTLWVDGVSCPVSLNGSAFTGANVGAMEFPLTLLNRNVRNAFSNGGTGLTLGLFARIPGVAYSGADLSGDPWKTLFAPRTIQVKVSAGGRTGTLTATLADVTSAATGTVALKADLTKTLADLTSTATGTVALTGTASPTLGALTSTATGTLALAGALAKTLDDATLASTATLALTGTASPTLADVTSTATGTVAITGTLTKTLDDVTLDAQGTSQTVAIGTLTATLADVTLSSAGTVLLKGSASITLGDCTIVATGVLPIVGTVGATLADATLVATGENGAAEVRYPSVTRHIYTQRLTRSIKPERITRSIKP